MVYVPSWVPGSLPGPALLLLLPPPPQPISIRKNTRVVTRNAPNLRSRSFRPPLTRNIPAKKTQAIAVHHDMGPIGLGTTPALGAVVVIETILCAKGVAGLTSSETGLKVQVLSR